MFALTTNTVQKYNEEWTISAQRFCFLLFLSELTFLLIDKNLLQAQNYELEAVAQGKRTNTP